MAIGTQPGSGRGQALGVVAFRDRRAIVFARSGLQQVKVDRAEVKAAAWALRR
jgi:hypothetical protein